MAEELYDWSALTPQQKRRLSETLEGHVEAIRQRIAEIITDEHCAMVRQWRVDDGLSWRGVASAAAEAIPGWADTDQIAGKMLCQHAAHHFGEDPKKEPWN